MLFFKAITFSDFMRSRFNTTLSLNNSAEAHKHNCDVRFFFYILISNTEDGTSFQYHSNLTTTRRKNITFENFRLKIYKKHIPHSFET